MSGYAAILPEIILLLAAGWAMFAEFLPGRDRGSAWVGVGAGVAATVAAAAVSTDAQLFGGLVAFDGPARFARVGIGVVLVLWLLWTASSAEGRIREAVMLSLFSAIGSMLMVASREIITMVLAIELATMPAYVMIGYRRYRIEGLEGALKYFLLSVLTSLVMLYGLSFLYGVTGSTHLGQLDLSQAGTLGVLAVLLSFVGLFAKLSAAPFHYWAPDAYEGAESWMVAFVSTLPKIAGAVVLVRLAAAIEPSAPILGTVLWIGAVASMVLGNLAALNQTDIRRMMAYSGVAHTGYLMLAVAAGNDLGYTAAVLYAVAYALPSLGVMLVVAEEGATIDDVAGLAARRPVAAWSMVLMLVSLIGIPPLIGFFGKLYLFTAALQGGLVWAVVVALAMSVVSAGYYLRIVRAMFFGARDGVEPKPWPVPAVVGVVGSAALTLALGLAAGPVVAAMGALIR